MRTSTLFTATLACLLVGLASGAQAATLTMSSDKSTYSVSETITITVIGDPQGAEDQFIFGTIEYNGLLVSSNNDATQNAGIYDGGESTWILVNLSVDAPIANTADSFSQICCVSFTKKFTNILTATMTFHAQATGVANFSWRTGSPQALDFFGLTNANGLSVTIVPEPTTAALLGLVVAGRRSRAR